jgi:hypothetical protein
MPSRHRRYAEWSPARVLREGAESGPATTALFEAIMKCERLARVTCLPGFRNQRLVERLPTAVPKSGLVQHRAMLYICRSTNAKHNGSFLFRVRHIPRLRRSRNHRTIVGTKELSAQRAIALGTSPSLILPSSSCIQGVSARNIAIDGSRGTISHNSGSYVTVRKVIA